MQSLIHLDFIYDFVFVIRIFFSYNKQHIRSHLVLSNSVPRIIKSLFAVFFYIFNAFRYRCILRLPFTDLAAGNHL